MYRPTAIEVGTLIGSFGLFFTCFLLFIRLAPMIATWEVKGLAGAQAHHEAREEASSASA
jgi:molybdopterin-containing oxidoreductase family membrane subunit